MVPHLPRLPVLLFVFLAVHVPASHGNQAPPLPVTHYSSMCPEPFMCGNVSIQYPFYLSNTTRDITGHNTSYSCGYTNLEMSCQGEGQIKTPVIRLGGDNDTVLNIFYDNSTVVLADSNVLTSDPCPIIRHNVTLDKVWLHYTSSNDNLTFFFGCGSVPSVLDKYRIDCNGFSRGPPGDGTSFLFTSDDHDRVQEQALAASCSELVSVPVRNEILMASNQSLLTRGGYAEVLRHGFKLEWSRITTDTCYLCEQSGGLCSYSQNSAFFGCMCSDGKVGAKDCRGKGNA
ncbi:unnamed protein product [Urochloa humidicola]